MESIDGSLRRLRTDYVDLYQAHRYDNETPLEETMRAFADVVRAGKALYIGVSEWTAEQIRAGRGLATELGIQLVSNQPQYSMLWRVIEAEVVPTSRGARHLADRLVADRAGRAHGQVPPGPAAAARAPARPTPRAARTSSGGSWTTTCSRASPSSSRSPRRLGLTLAQLAVAWVLQNDNVAAAIIGASRPEQVQENVKAAGVTIPPELLGRIDEVLGDSVQRDPSLTARHAPSHRPT